jgi:hypothetical protein
MLLPQPGQRIRLIAMMDDPNPLSPESMGTVVAVARHAIGQDKWFQVEVQWDNGRKLMLSLPPDQIEILAGDKDE